MSPDPVRVLVLYSHPLMGEGLGRMLAAEPGITVDAVDIADDGGGGRRDRAASPT